MFHVEHNQGVTVKYIVTKNEEGTEEIFMFPSRYHHSDMADTVNHLKSFKNGNPNDWERHYKTPVSAGFTNGVICQGYSETLDLKSRGEADALLIKA
jgi:hypothetical protein